VSTKNLLGNGGARRCDPSSVNQHYGLLLSITDFFYLARLSILSAAELSQSGNVRSATLPKLQVPATFTDIHGVGVVAYWPSYWTLQYADTFAADSFVHSISGVGRERLQRMRLVVGRYS
jgi:hypothetical protein